MKIKFNENDKTIEINDGLKSSYLFYKLLMILNLINTLLSLYNINRKEIGLKEIIWLILGTIALIVLYVLIVKRSTLEKIPIENIKRLKENSFFDRKRLFLELNNGRKRYLIGSKTQVEIDDLRKWFPDIGMHN